jgi:hypothetical protein
MMFIIIIRKVIIMLYSDTYKVITAVVISPDDSVSQPNPAAIIVRELFSHMAN